MLLCPLVTSHSEFLLLNQFSVPSTFCDCLPSSLSKIHPPSPALWPLLLPHLYPKPPQQTWSYGVWQTLPRHRVTEEWPQDRTKTAQHGINGNLSVLHVLWPPLLRPRPPTVKLMGDPSPHVLPDTLFLGSPTPGLLPSGCWCQSGHFQFFFVPWKVAPLPLTWGGVGEGHLPYEGVFLLLCPHYGSSCWQFFSSRKCALDGWILPITLWGKSLCLPREEFSSEVLLLTSSTSSKTLSKPQIPHLSHFPYLSLKFLICYLDNKNSCPTKLIPQHAVNSL